MLTHLSYLQNRPHAVVRLNHLPLRENQFSALSKGNITQGYKNLSAALPGNVPEGLFRVRRRHNLPYQNFIGRVIGTFDVPTNSASDSLQRLSRSRIPGEFPLCAQDVP